jgi:hypothetical protein
MPKSYERINYSLRPAKNIERKMLCEAFRRLSPFATVESYRYIGFGSTYFSDFELVHRTLGIGNMISIERDEENAARFIFNRPYRCITIRFGESTGVLPEILWNVRTILWLDYDGVLDATVLSDVSLFVANAVSGSVIVVTINADPERLDPERSRLGRLQERLPGRIPPDVEEGGLALWGTAALYRRILTNQIEQTLVDRNGGRPAGTRIQYHQLFNFQYSDGARMLTLGGVLAEEGQVGVVGQCAFQQLPFVRVGVDPFLIAPPNLTFREIRHLDSQLPQDGEPVQAPGVPARDIEAYSLLYRHFPMFGESEV